MMRRSHARATMGPLRPSAQQLRSRATTRLLTITRASADRFAGGVGWGGPLRQSAPLPASTRADPQLPPARCHSACSMAAAPSLQPQSTSASARSPAGCCSCRLCPGRSPVVIGSRLLSCAPLPLAGPLPPLPPAPQAAGDAGSAGPRCRPRRGCRPDEEGGLRRPGHRGAARRARGGRRRHHEVREGCGPLAGVRSTGLRRAQPFSPWRHPLARRPPAQRPPPPKLTPPPGPAGCPPLATPRSWACRPPWWRPGA
jgi:hypothetical protein